MKTKYYALVIVSLIVLSVSSCAEEAKPPIAEVSTIASIDPVKTTVPKDTFWIDKTYLGMRFSELKTVYKDLEFTEDHLYTYGIDSDGNGLLIKKNKKPFLFVWEYENGEIIHGICILSEDIVIDKNIHVGMTLREFMKTNKNPELSIDAIDESIEFIDNMPDKPYRIEFLSTDTNRVGEYKQGDTEEIFVKIKRKDAKIDQISIH